MRFLPYDPEQAYLLPPSVKDVRGKDHLCFFVHQVVERLDLRGFAQEYGEEGRLAYAPELRVKVWLYAYALQVTSSRRLEQRGIEGYVPDAHFSGAQQGRRGPLKTVAEAPAHRRMRARLRSPAGRARYRRRQALVEPVIGILKEQRGMRRFRLRGLSKVGVEVALTCTAFNLSRMWRLATSQ